MTRTQISTLIGLLFTALCAGPVAAVPDTIHIVSRLDPNAIIITEVDIVCIYDAELAAGFPATKKDWYSAKFMLTRNAGDKLDIVNTFVPQGFDTVDPPLPERLKQAKRILVFARHDDSETPAFDITDYSGALIEIDQFGIRVSDPTH
jgi:hypothetical protein